MLGALLLALLGAAPALADCPGATPATSCPWVGAGIIGQRGEGVLRFPQAVAVGPDGLIYVADQGSHVVQVFDPSGAFVREVGVAGTRPGELGAVGAIAVAPDNTLLVADSANRIARFDASGALIHAWGRSGTGVGEFHFGAGGGNDAGAGGGLAVSGQYVYVADTGNDRIQRFTIDGGHGAVIVPPGKLDKPQGLAVRGTRLAVADDRHHRIVVFDTGGHQLATVGAGPGPGPGQLANPYDVAFDPQGRLFVADDLNHRVVRFNTAPHYPYKARWGSYGTAPGQLAYPRGIATDAQGNVVVANTGNDRVDVFDRTGALLRSFGTSGRATGQFDQPLGVGADAAGFRAVADAVNGRLQLLAPDGSIATAWGSPAPGPTVLPRAVAVVFDAAGDAYVLDQRRARIVVFSRASGLPVRTIGAPGSGPGRLRSPAALAIDAAGTISVADTGNDRIARFTVNGTYLGSITGVPGARGIAATPDGMSLYVADDANHITRLSPGGDELDDFGGTGTKLGKLNAPAQLALDGAGNLWVADRGNNRVQQFGPDGQRLLAFGTRGTGLGQFVHPTGIAVDCRGGLTVTDSDNGRVQQFALAAPSPSPAACGALAALATPPPPKLPTLPSPVGPQVGLRVLRSTGLLRLRNLALRVGCDTTCRLTTSGTATPLSRPEKGRKAVAVTLSAAPRTIKAGQSAVVRLRVTRRQVARLRRALHHRRALRVDLQLSATSAGEQEATTLSRTVRVVG